MTSPAIMTGHGKYPGARWAPVGNFTAGGNAPRLLICHIMQGTLAGTDAWFRNEASQASAHFGVGRDGTVLQWVDCRDQAWHAVTANSHSIGVEHEGFGGQPLTSAQVAATGAILAWAMEQFPAVSRWLNTRPDTGSGLSWHGLGGRDWGNHPDCPGVQVVHQLPAILRAARRPADFTG